MPRHIEFEPGPGFVPVAKPDNPGNGEGNGWGGGDDGDDGDSSLVTGES